MHVLVTGATGFLGPQVVRALAERGDVVSIVSRRGASALPLTPGAVTSHTWDPLSGPPPAAALEGVDAVVHLAGETVTGRWSAEKRAAIRTSRVDGTRNLVAGIGAAAERPRTLVSASAIGYYGDRADEELAETAAPGDDFLAEVCTAWEAEAERATAHGLRVARLRFGIALGAGGGALQKMLLPAKLGAGGPIGSGRQWWSWIHEDDIVGLILHALDADVSGALNAAAPGAVRQRDFARALGRVLHRPAFAPLPAFVAKAALGGFATELLSSKHVVPAGTLASGYAFRFPELDAALRDALGR